MFAVALFSVAKIRKQPRWPSTGEQIKKTGHVYIVEYSVPCLVDQSCMTLCDSMDYSSICLAPLSMGILQAGILEWLPCPPLKEFPNPGIEPRSPTLQLDSLLSEPLGKSMNIEVGSLSLLQGISLTQKSNRGLPLCRWILYQLSYQGNPQWNITQP